MSDRLDELKAADRAVTEAVAASVPERHRCGPIEVDEAQWDRLTAALEARGAARAALMPTEDDALRLMFEAWQRLRDLGWREINYCPKDGSSFDAIEPGSTGVHRTRYQGEWPSGGWLAEDGGDLWPARPCLYRPTEAELAEEATRRERFRQLAREGREP